jgi:hypothetical protein
MHTTDPITARASGPPTLGDLFAEVLPLVGTVFVAGPPVLVACAGTVLFALMLAGPFALLVTVVVAAAAVVTFAGAVLATPYLLIRHFRLRLAKRCHVAEGSAPIAAVVIARTATATKQPAIAALAQSTTWRTAR